MFYRMEGAFSSQIGSRRIFLSQHSHRSSLTSVLPKQGAQQYRCWGWGLPPSATEASSSQWVQSLHLGGNATQVYETSFSPPSHKVYSLEKHRSTKPTLKRNPNASVSGQKIENSAEIRQFSKAGHVVRQPSWKILTPDFYTKCLHLTNNNLRILLRV